MKPQNNNNFDWIGGRKAFTSLLFFTVSLCLYVMQGLGWLNFEITFSQITNFWVWVAGFFMCTNAATHMGKAVTKGIYEATKKKNRNS